jgi:cytoskeletal protein CcmA (bactofilin family)
MGQIDNLNQGQLADLFARVSRLEKAVPLANASVGGGRLRFYDGGQLLVENGGLSVTGTATISGVLQADGTINLTGTVTISGPLTVTGDTKLNGPTHINGATDITGNTTVTGDFNVNGPMKTTGTLSVEGVTTLKTDLNVTTGGKVNVGSSMTLNPSTDGGSATFSNGAKLSSGTGAITMYGVGGTSTVTAASTSAGVTSGTSSAVMFNDGTWKVGSSGANIDALTAGRVSATGSTVNLTSGARQVNVTSTGTAVTGPFTVSNISTLSGPLINSGMTDTTNGANCWVSTGYQLYRVTSASRFKVDPQPMDLPDSLLDVPVKDWWDAGEVERDEASRRVPGVIAEEVEAAGGESFVTYDEHGTIQGVSYDRYALARTEVLARKLDVALARIKELEDVA